MRGRCPYNKPESIKTTCPCVFSGSVTVESYDFLTFWDLAADPVTLWAVVPHQVNDIWAVFIYELEFIKVVKISLGNPHADFGDRSICVDLDICDRVFNTCSFRFKEGAFESVGEFQLEAC